MARYKVGDKVRIKKGLDFGGGDGGFAAFGPHRLYCPSSMKEFEGQIMTVSQVNYRGVSDWLKCEEVGWMWCEEMVIPANQNIVSLTDKDIENIKSSSDAFLDLLR